MKTDYKFWYIRRDDDGWITETAVRFYEGDTVLREGKMEYQRGKKLNKLDLPHIADNRFINDSLGKPAVLYNQDDFGKIRTDDELRVFMNGELRKDIQRSPVEEQNTLDITKVK